ncbi:MAG: hypothetical protein WD673_10615 [Alphaproteobacteria bacterium]
MNPEFVRNAWIESRFHRFALATAAVGLIALVGAATSDSALGPLGQAGAFVFLVFMGSHAAALSIIGEVRNRTWDQQRLSALDPWSMVWGKLLGATLLAWFGGLLCVAILLIDMATSEGWSDVPRTLAKYVCLGVMAQGTAMLAALVTIDRFESVGRLQTFRAQLAGIGAGFAVAAAWPENDAGGPFVASWWGRAIDAESFALASLAVFTGWVLVGCHRLMRRELAVVNGPYVLMGFLAFLAAYVAGLDGLLEDWSDDGIHGADMRLLIMLSTLVAATLVLVVAERKDPVLYRTMFLNLRRVRFWPRVLREAQGWMLAWLGAALVVALILLHALLPEEMRDALGLGGSLPTFDKDVSLVVLALSALGFLTRDCALFVLCNGRRPSPRADSALIVALVLGYVATTWLLVLNDVEWLMPVFVPVPRVEFAYGIAAAWIEAAVAMWLARRRLA